MTGREFRRRRRHLELTQRELGLRLGRHINTIWQYEHGLRRIPDYVIDALQLMEVTPTPRKDMSMDESGPYRYFQGKETRQIDPILGQKAKPNAWYYEPKDYEGDTLWSQPYRTRHAAESASRQEPEEE